MNILWLSWKDSKHPQAGGAELVSSEIRKRLVMDGHSVRLITARAYKQEGTGRENGVEVFRIGNRYSVYWKAKKLYKKSMPDWADLVIDEMNVIPFLGFRYQKTKSILLTYQLARKVWFYQMTFPFSLVGYLIEPLYLRYLSHKYKLVITESQSTKQDLIRFGFTDSQVKTFRVGMNINPLEKLSPKRNLDTIISLGSVRPMKQTLHTIKAFELAKDNKQNLKLAVLGDYSGKYGKKVYEYALKSRYAKSIKFYGKVSDEEKEKLLFEAGLIVVSSVKEGWGLIATEAASQGVPAVSYATDGLKDSIIDNITGKLVRPGNYRELALKIVECLNNPVELEQMRKAGLEYSRQFTFSNSYSDFLTCTGILRPKEETK